MNNVVVVESPAKAKTINKYLGPGYTVLASYGHVRDLPPKDGSVRPDDDFAMSWQVDAKADKRLKDIAAAVKGADHLFLATDPDREGEAISWHVEEVLRQRKALKGVDVKRVVFNEVTKQAVLEAFRHPRELDRELVEAYLARRALDYLVGFTLVAGAVAQASRQPLGGPRAVGGAPPRVRARERDRGVPGAGILDRRGRVRDANGRALHARG